MSSSLALSTRGKSGQWKLSVKVKLEVALLSRWRQHERVDLWLLAYIHRTSIARKGVSSAPSAGVLIFVCCGDVSAWHL